MFRFLLRLTWLWLLLLASAALRAQPTAFVKHFGPAEGFAPRFVYALAQDPQGYLWVATAEGVVRYDGTAFRAFTTKSGLAEDFATRLYVQRPTGTLWVAHYQGGVSRWNGRRFVPVSNRAAWPDSLHAGPGIPSSDTAAVNSYARRHRLRLPDDAQVSCVLNDREGNGWLGTAGQGLWRHSDRHLRLIPTPPAPAGAITAAGAGGLALFGTAAGRLFSIGQSGSGEFYTRPAFSGSFPQAITAIAQATAPSTSKQADLLWIGTGSGVWQLRAGKAQLLSSLPRNLRVTALAWDAVGGYLWVGTALDGVYRCQPEGPAPAEHFTTANGLLHNTVSALLADAAGRVWIGTQGTGLAVWHQGDFTYHRFGEGLDVTDLREQPAGTVWIGTAGQGLWRHQQGKFRRYTTANGLASAYCYAVVPFRHSSGQASHSASPREFVLLVHQQELSAFDPATGQATPVVAADNPLLRGLRPFATVSSTANGVWLASSQGLLQLDASLTSPWPTSSPPTLALTGAQVDGAPRDAAKLGQLKAGQHRLNFTFQGVTLQPRPSSGGLQYQYRLRGYLDDWSQPSATGEAQFPRLDAGQYVLEARARLGSQGAWSRVEQVGFGIATPFWRTWWFAALALLTVGAGVWAVVRTREATLRRQKFQLETTVRERTTELRHQKAHIEQMNTELTVARDAAEASRKAKAQFLANMSHEIRTPMNAVIGLTHLLQRMPTTGEQREYLEAIQGSSQNLLTIINDILDSSKIEAGKLTLEHTPFGLRELLQRVGRMFTFATASKNLYLDLQLAPTVPAAVYGDPVRLNQILVNLIGNAIKFTTHGGVTVSATATAVPESAGAWRVQLAVRDTGIGIPANKLEAIFEDFSQANTSTTRQFGGTGLGLSIARNLVELHGGQLHVESQEGAGSTFWFEVPYQEADPASVPSDAPADLNPFDPPLRVLVAEDNELNQLVARKTLEAWNVLVTLAANGRLAVEAATAPAAAFDAVLMDVQMPEMDGYEATRQLRLHFPDRQQLPIIGLTASALPEDRALALEAGMNDTLPKPFDPAILYTRLAQFTGRIVPDSVPKSRVAPTAGVAPAAPLTLDWELLEELAFGNEAFIGQVIETFLREAPLLLEQLQQAAQRHDPAALGQAAHKLKGQVAYFGVANLHKRLDALERQVHAGETTDAAAQVAGIGQQLAELYPALRQRVQQTTPLP
ncbi:response regulator [Hymenobacter busanensis]|uniref:Sensory/regulatory protein RpfC n=1 Tax=Hymenobacter busanensis TaxID=2607656 RepID=A0A7L5A3I5_9BACT|nr:ATP-binding protein [Hymenobacter busanensis]KAA9338480.1 response regulator [Hymenobacter busanensis]QHJ09092.1 response regulator [Hymenobacter busanensis]